MNPSTRIRKELTCDDWRTTSDRTAAIRRADKLVGYVQFTRPGFDVHMGGETVGAGMTTKTALDTAALWLAQQKARR
jgi:hypothetical protein